MAEQKQIQHSLKWWITISCLQSDKAHCVTGSQNITIPFIS